MDDFWRGDGGESDLLDRQGIMKFDLRMDVLGTLDEASSAMGMARALATTAEGKALILELQEDVCWIMSELAAEDVETPQPRRLDGQRVAWLDETAAALEACVPRPSDFVAPGDQASGAALHLARAIVRRAERLVVRLAAEGRLHNPEILRYLNHLSMLLYTIACFEETSAGRRSPTPARSARRRSDERSRVPHT